MKLTKKITLNIVKQDDNYIVGNARDLSILVGTTSVSGNLHCFSGIKKAKSFWIVPKELVKKRVALLKGRLAELKTKINIMEEILDDK